MNIYEYAFIHSLAIIYISITLIRGKKIDFIYGFIFVIESLLLFAVSLNSEFKAALYLRLGVKKESTILYLLIIFCNDILIYLFYLVTKLKKICCRLVQEVALLQKKIDMNEVIQEEYE